MESIRPMTPCILAESKRVTASRTSLATVAKGVEGDVIVVMSEWTGQLKAALPR